MPNVDGWYLPSEPAWAVTYGYKIQVPWGLAKMELTVNFPPLEGKVGETGGMANEFFTAAIAPAISFFCVLIEASCYLWKLGSYVGTPGTFPPGQNGIAPLGQNHGIVAILLPNRNDQRGRQRLYFPACPRGWIDDRGQLNHDGAGGMRTHLHGMMGGLLGIVPNSPAQWMTYTRDAIRDPVTGFFTPGLSFVDHVRLVHYTARVPDYVP